MRTLLLLLLPLFTFAQFDNIYYSGIEVVDIEDDLYIEPIQKGTIIQFDEIWLDLGEKRHWFIEHELKAWQEYIDRYDVKYEVIGSTNEEKRGMVRGSFKILNFSR